LLGFGYHTDQTAEESRQEREGKVRRKEEKQKKNMGHKNEWPSDANPMRFHIIKATSGAKGPSMRETHGGSATGFSLLRGERGKGEDLD